MSNRFRYFLTVMLVIIVSSGLVTPAAAGTMDAGAGLLEKSPGNSGASVTFTVQVPLDELELEVIEEGGKAYTRVSIPGWVETGEEGAPKLPFVIEQAGAPVGAEIELVVIPGEAVRYQLEAPVLPVETQVVEWGLEEGDGGIPELPIPEYVLAEDPGVYGGGEYPGVLAMVTNDGYLRQQRVIGITVYPVQYDPASMELTVYETLEVEVIYRGGETGVGVEEGVESEVYEEVLGEGLLNYEEAKEWREPVGEVTLQGGEVGLEEAGIPWGPPEPGWRVKVRQDGMYKMSYTDLAGAGLPVGSLNPRTLKMYHMGEEIAIYVEGEGDGVFNAADYLVFYGQGIKSKYTLDNVYWLTYGGVNGIRIGERDGTPGVGSPLVYYPAQRHYEQNTSYLSKAPGDENLDRYLWGLSLYPPSRPTWTYNFTLAAPYSGAAGLMRLSLLGFISSTLSTEDHYVTVTLNGTQIGGVGWDGITWKTYEVAVPAGLLQANNTLVLRDIPKPAIGYDVVRVDWIELEFPNTFTAEGNALGITYKEAGTWKYRVTGFSTDQVSVFNITDAELPVRMSGVAVTGAGSVYDVEFKDTITGENDYWAVGGTGYKAVQGIEVDTASNLRSTANRADHIVITPRAFWTAAETLRAHRVVQGLAAVKVDVQDVYDEFGYGIVGVTAIRDFLAYTYGSWVDPAPSYVVLLGDGHYDPNNYLGYGRVSYIPPYLAPVDPEILETAADNRYVTVSGTDLMPDMMLGRMAVNTAAEAAAFVNKIIAYEQGGEANWQKEVLAIADNTDGGGNFAGYSDSLLGHLPAPYTATKVYLTDTSPTGVTNARNAILAGINSGKLVTNYIGHATVTAWAGEGLFKGSDVAELTNIGKPTIALSMDCYDGSYHYPLASSTSVDALAEVLTRVAEKGAVASWSPSGLGLASAHDYLNKGFFDALFTDEVSTIGQATQQGKQDLWDVNYAQDLMDTFLLFGDPAMQVTRVSPLTVSGTVTDSNHEPLPGVLISTGLGDSAVTDANGIFTFEGLPRGIYNFTPVKTGYVFTPGFTQVDLENSNTDVEGVDFSSELAEIYSISGIIKDFLGNPIDGVTVSDDKGNSTTTENGTYAFGQLTLGTYVVSVEKDDFVFNPLNRTVTISGTSQSGVDFLGDDLTVNDAPVITGQWLLSTSEDIPLSITLADLTVTDPDNIYPTDFTLEVLSSNNYTVEGNTITPATDFFGALAVPVKVNDGAVDSNTFDLTVSVTAVNDAPVITGQGVLSTNEDIPLTITLADLTVTDPDNAYPADFSLQVLASTNYTIEGNTITPAADFFGDISVPVKVNDGTLDSNTFNLTVSVSAVNDAPVITGHVILSTNEDTPLIIAMSDLMVTDPDDAYPADFMLTIISGTNYTFVDSTITPAADFYGALTVPVKVNDGTVDSNTFDLSVSVTAVNDAPFVSDIPDQVVMKGGSFVTINLDDYVSDVDNLDDEIDWSYSGNNELTVSITDRVATITKPDANWLGEETITFTATDPGTLSAGDEVIFKVIDSYPWYGQKLDNAIVVFNWDDILGTSKYNLQLSLYPDFRSLVLNTYTPESQYTYDVGLTNGTAYYWRIRPQLENQTWGEWLPASMFYSVTPPMAPLLDAPANAFISFIGTPRLSWNPVPNAAGYEIQVSESTSFAVILSGDENIDAVDPLSFTPTEVLGDEVYYWRVRAIDALGVTSPWSVYRWFTVNTTAPALVSPGEDAEVLGTPTYAWAAVSGAKGYEFQYTQGNFEPPDFTSGELSTTSYTPDEPQTVGTYTWRVGAKDALDNWKWSDTRSFTISLPVPAKTVLSSPANKAYVFTATPTLEWNSVDYADNYEIQISTSYLFTNPINEISDGLITTKEISGLQNLKYYWRVRAVNNVSETTPQYGAWSSYRYFTVNTTAPALVSPGEDAEVLGTPTYAWAAVSGAKGYEFQYTQGNFEPPDFTSGELSTTSYTPDEPQTVGTYTWRVGAKDALDNWKWSDTRSFTISLPVPAKTVLSSPANKAYVFTATPTLEWNSVDYADNYEIQISTSYLFTNPINEISDGLITTKEISGLQNLKYYWRVRAVNNVSETTPQYGAWSSYRYFTVNTTAPALVSPGEDAEVLGTPTYAWAAVSGAKGYEFQYTQGNFEPPDFTSGELSTTSYTPDEPQTVGTYTWRVGAKDALDNWKWSDTRSFTISLPVPAKTVLSSPANKAYVNENPPLLTWNDIPYAEKYELQISSSYRFYASKIVLNPVGILVTEYQPALADGKYYWRVRAVNEIDEPGAWSGYRYFILDTKSPAVPVLYKPSANSFTYDTTPSLSVKAASGAKYYRYQVADSSIFSNILVDSGDGAKVGTTYTVPSSMALPYRESYYWRVKSIDAAHNESEWSSPRSFTVTFQKTPSHGAYTVDTTPTFTWYAVSGALGYELEIMDDPAYAENQDYPNYIKMMGRVKSHTVSIISPLPTGRYLWQIRVRTTSGWYETPWRPLTIYSTPLLAAPTLVDPVSGAIPAVLKLTWEYTGADASKFEIWVDNSRYFTSREYEGVFGPDETTITLPTLPNGRYYWKMRTYNGLGVPGPWSAYRYFTVDI